MKLRIRDNSLRLRLTQTEVRTLRTDGRVMAETVFPGGEKLKYALECVEGIEGVGASMRDGAITIRVPAALALDWADSDTVSLHGDQATSDGQSLGLLVEKDFACLAPREGEDESDMYPHPQAGAR